MEKLTKETLHATDKLREMILENPDLPICILCDEDSYCDDHMSTLCTNIDCRKSRITEVVRADGVTEVIDNDEEYLREILYEVVSDMSEGDMSDQEIEQEVEDRLKKFEWVDCIVVRATN